PAEEPARRAERLVEHTGRARLEAGAVPRRAAVAVELELKALIGAEIAVVLRELNRAHPFALTNRPGAGPGRPARCSSDRLPSVAPSPLHITCSTKHRPACFVGHARQTAPTRRRLPQLPAVRPAPDSPRGPATCDLRPATCDPF